MQDVFPRSLNDYRNAIDCLNKSTDGLKTQAQATQRVLIALPNQKAKIQDVTGSRTDHERQQQQQTSTLIANLRDELQDENQLSSERLREKLLSSLITISDTLCQHDYLINQLESQLSSNQDTIELKAERQQSLLDALRYTLSEVIKARLNRVYLETSTVAYQNGAPKDHNVATSDYDSQRSSTKQAEDIKADLRSLYAEIDDVAQMRVNHEHGDQIFLKIKQLEESQQRLSNLHTAQSLRQLRTMTNQLYQITAHCEALQSQRIAQQRLEAYFEDIWKAEHSKHPISNVPSGTGNRKDDGPAIAALRQYLSLSDGGNASTQRDEQAKQAFEEFTMHTQTSVELRNQQARFLDSTGGESASHMSTGTTCEAKLSDLDAHIAKLKAQMDIVSG